MLLETLFPQGSNATPHSIDGLSLGDVPQNCEVVDSFVHKMPPTVRQDVRKHYLLRFRGNFYHIRVCQAAEGSGYEAFAALINSGSMSDYQFERMKKSFT